MFKEFESHIRNRFPDLLKETCILACSAGLDSVVLAHLCVRLELDVELAHCNFQLRGEESLDDEEFVKDLSKKLGLKAHVKRFDTETYAKENKLSIQVSARNLRYTWFRQLAEEKNLPYILTAHHADDSLETFLINLSRGTGIQGLTGIPERSGIVLRPLLSFSRIQIKAYAHKYQINWREDSTNEELYYLRNKIRHEITPKLKELHPNFLQNFQVTQSHLIGSASILRSYISELRSSLFVDRRGGWEISVKSLENLKPNADFLYALFSEYGFTEWDNVRDILQAPSGKQIRSKTHRLVKDREVLLLARLENEEPNSYYFELNEVEINAPLPIKIELVPEMTELSNEILYVDKETLNHRLEVRKWKKGDYFYPLGMKGRKLVSKFFKDEKYSALDKEQQWLLFSEDRLVWIIGKRADDRFKVTPDTAKILRFRLVR